MLYGNILVALDDSEHSEAALIEAAHWAKRHDGGVCAAHAVFFDSEEFSVSPSQLDKRIENGSDLCSRVTGKYSKELGVRMECVIRQGEPHEVIPELARERKADLIALGTYGRKGLRRLVMGSVTAGVILDSPCDVLVVKKPCEKCTGVYSSLLVAYDGSEQGKKAIERAVAMKKADPGVYITLMYVIPRYEEMLGFYKTNSIREKMYEEARKIVREGEEYAHQLGEQVSTMVDEGSPPETISETAKKLGSELLILGSHGWRGMSRAIMGSTTDRVIAYSTVPVLVAR